MNRIRTERLHSVRECVESAKKRGFRPMDFGVLDKVRPERLYLSFVHRGGHDSRTSASASIFAADQYGRRDSSEAVTSTSRTEVFGPRGDCGWQRRRRFWWRGRRDNKEGRSLPASSSQDIGSSAPPETARSWMPSP